MAKITYETDSGHKISAEIAESLITDLEEAHRVNAWKEILDILRKEIIAINKLQENEDGIKI